MVSFSKTTICYPELLQFANVLNMRLYFINLLAHCLQHKAIVYVYIQYLGHRPTSVSFCLLY